MATMTKGYGGGKPLGQSGRVVSSKGQNRVVGGTAGGGGADGGAKLPKLQSKTPGNKK